MTLQCPRRNRPLLFAAPDPLVEADAWSWLVGPLAEQTAAAPEPTGGRRADRLLLATAAKGRR